MECLWSEKGLPVTTSMLSSTHWSQAAPGATQPLESGCPRLRCAAMPHTYRIQGQCGKQMCSVLVVFIRIPH
jgi:hypothetical protein